MYEKSEELYLQAISIKKSALFWGNLGVLYHRWNRRQQAIDAYQTALVIDNNFQNAKVNLEKLLSRKR